MLGDLESTNPTSLVMDPKHPGLNDDEYNERRAYFFEHSRQERLAGRVASEVNYTDAEQKLWQFISNKLEAVHEKYASKLYIQGKRTLNINSTKIPQQSEVNALLAKHSNFSVLPAEGLLSSRSFFYCPS